MGFIPEQKNGFYRRIKIGGMMLFIPMVLAAGPLGGYFLGEYLEARFLCPRFVTFILLALGFFAAFRETIRIIAMAIKIEQDEEKPGK